MSQDTSVGEKPAKKKLHWTQDPKNKARLRKMRKVANRARAKKGKIRGGVPLYLYTLAKRVKNGAIARMAETNEAGEFELDALLLARKVMEGDET